MCAVVRQAGRSTTSPSVIPSPEAARSTINQWVAGETADKIPQVLPQGSITSDTLFVIVNAIYFKAGWLSQFEPSVTAPQPFTRDDGTTESVPTMQQTSSFAYAESAGWKLVELPYAGGQVAMDIVLPAPGTDVQFDKGLTAAIFTSMTAAMLPSLVQLALPQFKVQGPSFSLKTALQALGMQTALSCARTSGGPGRPRPHLDAAFHRDRTPSLRRSALEAANVES